MGIIRKRWFHKTVGALVAVIVLAGVAWAVGPRIVQKLTEHKESNGGHGNSHGHGEDDGHAHEEPKATATVWAHGVELFIDHDYMIAGQPVELAIHLTKLSDGKPISKANIHYAIANANKRATVSVDTPAEPGIFLAVVRAPAAGEYLGQVTVHSSDIPNGRAEFQLPTTTVYADDASVHAAAALQLGGANEITYLKPQQWRFGLQTAVVTPTRFIRHLKVPGKVVAPHPSEAVVPPPIPGRVHPPPDGHFAHVGDQVKKGQILAVIEPSIIGAEAVQLMVNQAQLKTIDAELAAKQLETETQVAATALELQLAEETYRRKRELVEKNVAAGKELLQAKSEMDQAESKLAGLRRLVETYKKSRQELKSFSEQTAESFSKDSGENSLRVPLRSPIDGTLVEADATAGEFVDRIHPLFRVINLDRLFIDARVSEYDLEKVEKSKGARYRLPSYPGRTFPIFPEGDGRLVFIGSVVDPESRTVHVRYDVPNEQGILRVDMFADVLIQTGMKEDALAVPIEAVVDDNGESIVYVQQGGESFERRSVTLGMREDDLIEIQRGLSPGDRVVSKGAYLLRLSTLSGSIPAHHH